MESISHSSTQSPRNNKSPVQLVIGRNDLVALTRHQGHRAKRSLKVAEVVAYERGEERARERIESEPFVSGPVPGVGWISRLLDPSLKRTQEFAVRLR